MTRRLGWGSWLLVTLIAIVGGGALVATAIIAWILALSPR
jgi:hypothetical protein